MHLHQNWDHWVRYSYSANTFACLNHYLKDQHLLSDYVFSRRLHVFWLLLLHPFLQFTHSAQVITLILVSHQPAYTHTHFLPSCIPPPPQCDIEQSALSDRVQLSLQQSFFTPLKRCSYRGSFRAARAAWASHGVCDTNHTTARARWLLWRH